MKALLFIFLATNAFAMDWNYKIKSERYPTSADGKTVGDARKEWFFGKVTCSLGPTEKDELSETRTLLCQTGNVYFSTRIICLKQENISRQGYLHFSSETTKDVEMTVECAPN